MTTAQRASSIGSRKLLLAIHLVFTGSWLGATGAMTFLAAIGVFTDNVELRQSAYLVMSRMDIGLIVPLVFLSIISGVILALKTPWGLFRHRWVVAKLAIAASMVVFAVSTVMPWVQELATTEVTREGAASAAQLSAYLLTSALVFLAGLFLVVLIAVYKPWGKIGQTPALPSSQ